MPSLPRSGNGERKLFCVADVLGHIQSVGIASSRGPFIIHIHQGVRL